MASLDLVAGCIAEEDELGEDASRTSSEDEGEGSSEDEEAPSSSDEDLGAFAPAPRLQQTPAKKSAHEPRLLPSPNLASSKTPSPTPSPTPSATSLPPNPASSKTASPAAQREGSMPLSSSALFSPTSLRALLSSEAAGGGGVGGMGLGALDLSPRISRADMQANFATAQAGMKAQVI